MREKQRAMREGEVTAAETRANIAKFEKDYIDKLLADGKTAALDSPIGIAYAGYVDNFYR